jgi:hypothetical protein
MIDLAKREELRSARNLLTVALLNELVQECLGAVPVLAMLGRARSGKTWAAVDWLATRRDDKEHAALLDCKGGVFGKPAIFEFGGVKRDVAIGHYPKFALDGLDVVIVDDAPCNPKLVDELIEKTAPDAGTAAHRLIILFAQRPDELQLFDFGQKQFMTYSTNGLPI